jgi:hypothetical protein
VWGCAEAPHLPVHRMTDMASERMVYRIVRCNLCVGGMRNANVNMEISRAHGDSVVVRAISKGASCSHATTQAWS